MSMHNTPPACGSPSAPDTNQQPSNLASESQMASGLTTEGPEITNEPSTNAGMTQHGMPRVETAATTTTNITTVSSDAPARTCPSNPSPTQQQKDPTELTELVGALNLRSPDQPASPSSGRESGYEADGERKLGSKASRKQPSRRELRKRQRRRPLGETAVMRRTRSSSPSLRPRTTQAARQRQSHQVWRRSL